jgi:hypothetical protein
MLMLVLDIETIPTAEGMAVPYSEADNPPPANYSKPEAIAGHHEKGRAAYATKRAKECSINPRLGRVLCIGTNTVARGPEMLYATTDGEEEGILRAFWDSAFEDATPLVTWNGSWDLRFLWVRAMRYRITPTFSVAPYFKRYTTDPHFDCKAALMQDWAFRGTGEGLDEWSQFFGYDGKSDGWDGSKVYPAFLEGRHAEIQQYCAADVARTAEIYNAIRQSL